MDLRDKFLKSMRRQAAGYIPFEFDLCPSKLEEFKEKYGTDDYYAHFGFPFGMVGAESIRDIKIFHQYYDSIDNIGLDDWGVGYKAGTLAHFTLMQHPMQNFRTLADFEGYPYPSPDEDYRWDRLPGAIREIRDRGLAVVGALVVTIFEMAWYLRGMAEFLIDMIENPGLSIYHLDRITEIRCEFAKRYAALDVDVLYLGDDIATQLDMMMSPDTWRAFIKPRLAKVIQRAKAEKPDLLIAYHSDGNIQKVIPDLIECGVEILNPIQPECMDPIDIKKLYGDRLSFWGTVGTQTTMPFGSARDVKDYCKQMIKEVGEGGGLLLAPTHTIEPEVPWENIEAFVDVVRDYNGI